MSVEAEKKRDFDRQLEVAWGDKQEGRDWEKTALPRANFSSMNTQSLVQQMMAARIELVLPGLLSGSCLLSTCVHLGSMIKDELHLENTCLNLMEKELTIKQH